MKNPFRKKRKLDKLDEIIEENKRLSARKSFNEIIEDEGTRLVTGRMVQAFLNAGYSGDEAVAEANRRSKERNRDENK